MFEDTSWNCCLFIFRSLKILQKALIKSGNFERFNFMFRWSGQGGLACCDSWGHKESDTTEWLNWTELNWRKILEYLLFRLIRFLGQLSLTSLPGFLSGEQRPSRQHSPSWIGLQHTNLSSHCAHISLIPLFSVGFSWPSTGLGDRQFKDPLFYIFSAK